MAVTFLDEHNGAITAVATVMIMLLTIFYVVYSKKQWQSTNKSANAAQDAASIARETLLRGQRPWVGPEKEPIISFNKSSPGTPPKMSVLIKNYGASPALHVGYNIQAATIGNSLDLLQKVSQSTCSIAATAAITADHRPSSESYGFYMLPNAEDTVAENNPRPQKVLSILCWAVLPIRISFITTQSAPPSTIRASAFAATIPAPFNPEISPTV